MSGRVSKKIRRHLRRNSREQFDGFFNAIFAMRFLDRVRMAWIVLRGKF